MTVNRGPGVAKDGAVGTTTLEHRLQLAGLYAENAPGVPRSGVLAHGSSILVFARSDMSYDVVPFQSVISRTASEGVYTPTVTGTVNVPTTAAPATDSRWDLTYIKQNDVAKGDADNQAVLGVVQGTTAATPTKPTGSVPAGAMVLSESRIFAGTAGTVDGSNTIAQVWRHTAARGAPIPVRNLTERGEITGRDGVMVQRLDLPWRPIESHDGTAWSVSDLAWTNLATVQGFTANNTSGWAGIKYAVKDGWVIVNGSVSRGSSWGNDQTIAVIPAALKPAYKIQGSGGLQVEPTVGNITLNAGSTAASFSATWPLF